MTSDQRIQMHYDEAVQCLNAIRDQPDVDVAATAAPTLIQAAIAHALLGLLVAQVQGHGA